MSLSAPEAANHPPQSGRGAMDMPYIPSLGRFALQIACRAMDGARVHPPCCRAGLVHRGRVLARRSITLEVDFLHRSCGGGAGETRHARDIQHPLSCIAAQYPAGQWIRAASSPRPSSSRYWPPVRSKSACLSVFARKHLPVTDGKGSWRDTIFIERLWRSITYEEVYLRAIACLSEARAGIGRYLLTF